MEYTLQLAMEDAGRESVSNGEKTVQGGKQNEAMYIGATTRRAPNLEET
jgi:hypothetical protein